ncbi:response regulator [Candidatus Borrarchaeum sp.]|uniref:response regulator n=1 Tax=Candidatus Borrarchaeum sp. TaxID=2846742 RepID=UPI002579AE54|nr:response regulator [Candidatus Borrarchaeum sp.]
MARNLFKVLLIEDNPGDVRLIQEELTDIEAITLHNINFELTKANQLSKGLKCLHDQKIDLILLDLMLPDSLGIDTFMEVHLYAQKVPIIVLTGINDEKLAIKAVNEGAQDYIVKGKMDTQLLMQSIIRAIGKHRVSSKLKKS